jgi:hypothetical protein
MNTKEKEFQEMVAYDFSNLDLGQKSNDNYYSHGGDSSGCKCDGCFNCES